MSWGGERSEHKRSKLLVSRALPQPVSQHPERIGRPSTRASEHTCGRAHVRPGSAGGVRGVSPLQPSRLPASATEEQREQRQQQRHLVIFAPASLVLPPARDFARFCRRRRAATVAGPSTSYSLRSRPLFPPRSPASAAEGLAFFALASITREGHPLPPALLRSRELTLARSRLAWCTSWRSPQMAI